MICTLIKQANLFLHTTVKLHIYIKKTKIEVCDDDVLKCNPDRELVIDLA